MRKMSTTSTFNQGLLSILYWLHVLYAHRSGLLRKINHLRLVHLAYNLIGHLYMCGVWLGMECMPNRDTFLKAWIAIRPQICYTLQWLVKFLKEGQNLGFDPYLRKLSMRGQLRSSCTGAYYKSWDKYLRAPLFIFSNSQRILRSKLRYAHGTHCPKSCNDPCKTNSAHPS